MQCCACGWRQNEAGAILTLEQIAAAAKVPPVQAKKSFANKDQLLSAIVRQIDARTVIKAGKINPRDTAHDRLFEVMMARFDALQEHRMGILSILNETRRDPSLARLIIPAQIQSMQKLLEQARVTSAARAQLAAFGLLVVYYRALWCWQKDSTRDMAKDHGRPRSGPCAARASLPKFCFATPKPPSLTFGFHIPFCAMQKIS